MKKIYVSILHFNKPDQTNECLNSLDKTSINGFKVKVLLIDNHSTIPYKVVKKYSHFEIELIRTEKNLGFAGGHNIAFKKAVEESADYIMILNNDTIVDKDMVISLLETCVNDSSIGIVSPKIYFTKGHEFHKDRYSSKDLGKVIWYAGGIIDWKNIISSHRGVDEVDRGQYNLLEETEFCTGACMMIPVAVIKKMSGFDEKYFLYYEDGDLNVRIKNAGYKLIYQPLAVLWHNNAGSSSSGSELQDYYISRNRMLFGITYAPIRSKIALIRQSISILKSGRKWQKIGVRDYYLRKFGKGSYTPK